MEHILKYIDSLNERAFANIFIDNSLSETLTEDAMKLSVENNYTIGIAWCLLNSGLVKIDSGNQKESHEKLKQSNRIFKEIATDKSGIVASENALGLMNIRLGKMEKAFSNLQKALILCRKHSLKEIEYTTINYLGILQYKSGKYTQALRFFEQASKLATKGNETRILNNLGSTHRVLGHNKKAISFLEEALAQAEKEKRTYARIAILEEIGLTYGQKEDYEKAIGYLKTALNLCDENHLRFKLSLCIHLGELYLEQKDFLSAETALLEGEKLITEANSINNRNLYFLLSKIHENKGDCKKALHLYKKFHSLSEKLNSTDLDEKIWLLETEQFRKINRQIKTISEMGKKLTAYLKREEVLQTLVESLSTLFHIDFCLIGEVSHNSFTLKTEIFDLKREESHSKQLKYEIPRNIASWVALHKSGLKLNNIEEEFLSYGVDSDHSFLPGQVSSALCLPYETAENRGVIAIFAKKENIFNDEDWELMEMLTSYAAIALNNTKQTETIKKRNEELIRLNRFDNLLGIFNRTHILKLLENAWKSSCRNKSFIHVILLDLDHFKDINDKWGHDAGDACLIKIGEVFKKTFQRSMDGYGRYGGEEFIIYLQDMSTIDAAIMAEKVREKIEESVIPIKDEEIRVTASIGLCSIIPPHKGEYDNVLKIIKEADKNMYLSKGKGRNIVTASIL
jgi:diguanylate cyclase (GGDEF)-like protein